MAQELTEPNAGQGGHIQIRADNLIRTPDSEISASAARGINGTVALSTPVVDLTGGLAVLPTVFIDAGALLRESCARQTDVRTSHFTQVGRGRLPPSPDELSPAFYATVLPTTAPAGASQTGVDRTAAGAYNVNAIPVVRLVASCATSPDGGLRPDNRN